MFGTVVSTIQRSPIAFSVNNMPVRPLRIFFKPSTTSPLKFPEIKYVFRTLLTTAGIPWHFVQSKGNGDIDIIYADKPDKCKLFIQEISKHQLKLTISPRIVRDGNICFLEFRHEEKTNFVIRRDRSNNVQIWNDIVYSIFFLLTGQNEKFMSRKKWDIHNIQTSFLYKERLLHLPLINEWVDIIVTIFKKTHKPIDLWPNGKSYCIALTHDVDYPKIVKPIEIIRYIKRYRTRSKLGDIINIVNGIENFWKFEEWTKIEKSYGLRSAFYFCGFSGNLLRYLFVAPDPFYDVTRKKFKNTMIKLIANGCEIGIHSSFLAYQSLKQFVWEKKIIEEVCNRKVYGNRHHYWHLNQDAPHETARLHAQVGLVYDSSLGFEEHSGFRRSICTPYRLYDPDWKKPTEVIQLPPTLMDSHLFDYQHLNDFRDYREQINSLCHAIQTYHGIFVCDFHVRVLNNLFFPMWRDAYKHLLNQLCSRNGHYSATPIEIANHWICREKIIESASIDNAYSTD